jgi:hypothetical protein
MSTAEKLENVQSVPDFPLGRYQENALAAFIHG